MFDYMTEIFDQVVHEEALVRLDLHTSILKE